MSPGSRRLAPSVRPVSLISVRKILLTGMSGTGKSTALAELEKRGFRVVDTDEGGWSEWSDPDGGYVWREVLSDTARTVVWVCGSEEPLG